MSNYGICGQPDCDEPLIGAHTIILGNPTKHHYCPRCHNNTPPLPGVWTPVGGGTYVRRADAVDEVRRRAEIGAFKKVP